MVSNKTLALFIIATVIVSLGGTLLSLNKLQEIAKLRTSFVPTKQVTGLASGLVDLTINSNASCIINSNVSFGASGQPGGQVILSTNAVNSGSFNDCTTNALCRGMQINNTGNVNVNVTLYSDKNGTTMLGGPGAANGGFNVSVANGTAAGGVNDLPGCVGGLAQPAAYVNETERIICSNLTYIDTNDIITAEYNVTLDQNTPVGTKTASIIITCAQV